jgi:dienelactone hydrolase
VWPNGDQTVKTKEFIVCLDEIQQNVDPHVPVPARRIIRSALQASGARHTYLELPGEHAFMRDEGARYDPAMADRVFVEAIALYRRTFG